MGRGKEGVERKERGERGVERGELGNGDRGRETYGAREIKETAW